MKRNETYDDTCILGEERLKMTRSLSIKRLVHFLEVFLPPFEIVLFDRP